MKKLFTIALLLMAGFYGKAQILATFEEGATDLLELGSKWYEPARFTVEPGIGDNPDKSGLNTSDKCYLAVNAADADWWGNFGELAFKTPVTITENNRYLKFLAYRSIQPKSFRVAVNGDHEEASQVYYGTLSEDAKWQGVVVDLGAKYMGQEINSIVFVFSTNWNDPRTGWGVATYAFDDFELSNDPIPTGETVKDPTGFNLNFEDQTAIDNWVNVFDPLNEANTYSIINNPFTASEVNPSGKVVEFNKSDQASWWQGFRTQFTGTMKLDDNTKYLHVMVYVPESALADRMGVDVQLCAKDHTGAENTYLETVWDDQVDEWIDIVMELNSINYMKELTVRFDVETDEITGDYINSPAHVYYVDEITLNDSPDPRSEIVNGVKDPRSGSVLVYADAQRIHVSDVSGNAGVKVYNAIGMVIRETTVEHIADMTVDRGLYIVLTESNGKKSINKVLVK